MEEIGRSDACDVMKWDGRLKELSLDSSWIMEKTFCFQRLLHSSSSSPLNSLLFFHSKYQIKLGRSLTRRTA